MFWAIKGIFNNLQSRKNGPVLALLAGLTLALPGSAAVAFQGNSFANANASVIAHSSAMTAISQQYPSQQLSGLNGGFDFPNILPRSDLFGQFNHSLSEAIDEAEVTIKAKSLQTLIWQRIGVAIDFITGNMKQELVGFTPVVDDTYESSSHCKDKKEASDRADALNAGNSDETDKEEQKQNRKIRKRSGFFAF